MSKPELRGLVPVLVVVAYRFFRVVVVVAVADHLACRRGKNTRADEAAIECFLLQG